MTYILGEHDAEVLTAQWREMGLVVPPRTLRVIGPAFRLPLVVHGRPQHDAIRRYQEWVKGSTLVVWDPLGAFLTGIDAENDNTTMRQALNAMVEVGQDVPATLVLHHMGKPDKEGNHPPRYAARGASAIEDSVRALWYLTAESASHHQPSWYRIKQVKYKSSPRAPAWIRLRREGVVHHLETFARNGASKKVP